MQEKAEGRSVAPQAGYGIAAALITAFGITIPLMLVLAAVLTFTDFPERYTTIAVLLATLTGLLIAGFKAGIYNDKNGMLKGGVAGLAYMLILYLASSILFSDFMLNQNAIIMVLTGILAGAIGGIIGTNRKKKPAKKFGGFGRTVDPFKKYRK